MAQMAKLSLPGLPAPGRFGPRDLERVDASASPKAHPLQSAATILGTGCSNRVAFGAGASHLCSGRMGLSRDFIGTLAGCPKKHTVAITRLARKLQGEEVRIRTTPEHEHCHGTFVR